MAIVRIYFCSFAVFVKIANDDSLEKEVVYHKNICRKDFFKSQLK